MTAPLVGRRGRFILRGFRLMAVKPRGIFRHKACKLYFFIFNFSQKPLTKPQT